MNASALIGHVETNAVVRTWKVHVNQVDAGQPTVVMADDGRALTVDDVRQFVPNPCFRDLNRCEGIGR